MTLAPADKRLLLVVVICGGLLVLGLLAGGCAAPRAPDYFEVPIWATRGGGDFSYAGTAEPGPKGKPFSATGDSDSASYGVGLTFGWLLTAPGADVVERLDAFQAAMMARPVPEAAMISIPRPDADPALLGALEALTVSVRRLEEAIAAPEAAGSPGSDSASDAPEEPPTPVEAQEAAVGDDDSGGSLPWGLAKAGGAIAAVLALARWWPDVWGAVCTVFRFIRRG